VQLAEAEDHRLVGVGDMLDLQARVLGSHLGEDFPEALLVAALLRLDRLAIDRRGQLDRQEMDVVVLGRIVQHRVEVISSTFATAQMSPGTPCWTRRAPCPAAGTDGRP
jgi:hypothetical protein